MLTSWLAFGEVIDRLELVAGLAVVGGVLFASRPPRRAGGPQLPVPAMSGIGSEADSAPSEPTPPPGASASLGSR